LSDEHADRTGSSGARRGARGRVPRLGRDQRDSAAQPKSELWWNLQDWRSRRCEARSTTRTSDSPPDCSDASTAIWAGSPRSVQRFSQSVPRSQTRHHRSTMRRATRGPLGGEPAPSPASWSTVQCNPASSTSGIDHPCDPASAAATPHSALHCRRCGAEHDCESGKARRLIEAELDPRCRERRSPHRGRRMLLPASTRASTSGHTKTQSERWCWFRSSPTVRPTLAEYAERSRRLMSPIVIVRSPLDGEQMPSIGIVPRLL
jgi:hypothetical protein